MLSNEDIPIKVNKYGFDYFYYYNNIPRHFKVNELLEDQRKYIMNFRNGSVDKNIISEKLLKDLYYFELGSQVSDWWFCIIPTINQERTDKRFKSLCESFSNVSTINNGFDILKNNPFIDTIIYEIDRRCADMLHHCNFENVSKRKIFLFDDVISSGTTFSTVANELMALGALEVKGVFLGKVYCPKEELEESIKDIL